MWAPEQEWGGFAEKPQVLSASEYADRSEIGFDAGV